MRKMAVVLVFLVATAPMMTTAAPAQAGPKVDGVRVTFQDYSLTIRNRDVKKAWAKTWAAVRRGGCITTTRVTITSPSGNVKARHNVHWRSCDKDRDGVATEWWYWEPSFKAKTGYWTATVWVKRNSKTVVVSDRIYIRNRYR